jgi:hypothetical protein
MLAQYYVYRVVTATTEPDASQSPSAFWIDHLNDFAAGPKNKAALTDPDPIIEVLHRSVEQSLTREQWQSLAVRS